MKMFRIKNLDTKQYYSRKWSRPTFTCVGKVFKNLSGAECVVQKITE